VSAKWILTELQYSIVSCNNSVELCESRETSWQQKSTTSVRHGNSRPTARCCHLVNLKTWSKSHCLSILYEDVTVFPSRYQQTSSHHIFV